MTESNHEHKANKTELSAEDDLIKNLSKLKLATSKLKMTAPDAEMDNNFPTENNPTINTPEPDNLVEDPNSDSDDDDEVKIIVEPEPGTEVQNNNLAQIRTTLSILNEVVENISDNLILIKNITGRIDVQLAPDTSTWNTLVSQSHTVRNVVNQISNTLLEVQNVVGKRVPGTLQEALDKINTQALEFHKTVEQSLEKITLSLVHQTEHGEAPAWTVVMTELNALKALCDTRAPTEMVKQELENIAGSPLGTERTSLKDLGTVLLELGNMAKTALETLAGSVSACQTKEGAQQGTADILKEIKELRASIQNMASAKEVKELRASLQQLTPVKEMKSLSKDVAEMKAMLQQLTIQPSISQGSGSKDMLDSEKLVSPVSELSSDTQPQETKKRKLDEGNAGRSTQEDAATRETMPVSKAAGTKSSEQRDLPEAILFEVSIRVDFKNTEIFATKIMLPSTDCSNISRLDAMASTMMMPEFLAVLKSKKLWDCQNAPKFRRKAYLFLRDDREESGQSDPLTTHHGKCGKMYNEWFERNVLEPQVKPEKVDVAFVLELYAEDDQTERQELKLNELVEGVEKTGKDKDRYFFP